MKRLELNPHEFHDLLATPGARADVVDLTGVVVAVDLSGPTGLPHPVPADAVSLLPAVVVGVVEAEAAIDDAWAARCDVLVDSSDVLEQIVATVEDAPIAATALVWLLRSSEHCTVEEGLHAESAVYSTLQAGPEFAAWRARNQPRVRDDGGPVVRATRVGDTLELVLDRPAARNALNARMRDELCDALEVALADPSVRTVSLSGTGPAFCSGGDLDEFGTRPDPAAAHLVRIARSPARMLASLADRVVATIHGACVGSGIELPAFAGRVVARDDMYAALPELRLGLVPGAGGTVSLPRRIGRHRTALLALTGTTVDARTALGWGLVDAIESG